MLRFIKQIFIWWDGQTIGTRLAIWRKGVKVGEDQFGNIYYRSKDNKRRWVVYNGEVDATMIPVLWHSWMHHTSDVIPDQHTQAAREWEQPHQPNLTGSPSAYRPKSSLAHGNRPSEQAGYEAWQPE